ncbi:MAG TPA: SDR family oxidoreductase [Vineibacter sp.]|nr:SDR family oxidoreductase [Vineibacter sp.]
MSADQPVRRYPEMQGKIALVTGGTSGIGLATAQAFAREGASVVLASRDETRAQAALRTFPEGAAVSWIVCDTASGASVASLVASIQARHGRLDYAFNNGGSGGGGPIATMSEDTWRRAIDGYLTSVFLCMRQQIPVMLAGGGGVIVNNSSVDGLRGYPFPGGGAYAAAKHGVLGLTKSAALEHAASGLRITAICPGWVDTPPVARWISDPKTAAEIVRQTPRGRIGTPEEIANAVLWLCSDAASFMIGSPLVVDGGYMA